MVDVCAWDELTDVDRKIGNIVKAIEDGAVDYEILSGRLRALKARRDELQTILDTLKSPFSEITEEMVSNIYPPSRAV